jgi:uncharacterized protein
MSTFEVKTNPFPALARIDPDRSTEVFWRAAHDHRFLCQRCESCGAYRMPPGPYCWRCTSGEHSWEEIPGTGSVYSYSVINYTLTSQISPDDLPYVVVVIELDRTDGTKFIGNLVGLGALDVSVGQRVCVYWDDIEEPQVTIPRFKLAERAAEASAP